MGKVNQIPGSRSADSIAAREQVYRQLDRRFPKSAIAWVKLVPWDPAQKVRLDDFDTGDEQNWAAFRAPDHVQREVEQYEKGRNDPIIAVVGPGKNAKALIIDGHHRFLAREKMDKGRVEAYIGHVPSDQGPWLYTHLSQKGGDSG